MLKNKKIGFCMTGSFFTLKYVIPQIKKLVDEEADVIPIMSDNCYKLDTKFGNANDFINEIEKITSHKIINNLIEAEDFEHNLNTDIMAIVPCTGNTIAKLANGIVDTPVLLAVKSHLKKRKKCCNWDINK